MMPEARIQRKEGKDSPTVGKKRVERQGNIVLDVRNMRPELLNEGGLSREAS